VPEPTALFRLIHASGGGRRSGARQLIRFALYGAFDPVAAAVVAGMMVLFFLLAVIGYDPQRGMLRRAAQAQPA
jgi:ABC-2 type transport system permease protein